jgi:hypothetical protein
VTSAITEIGRPPPRSIVIACVAGAVGLWLSGVVSGIEWRDMTDLGLISVLPIVYFGALGLLTIGFVIAVFTPTLTNRWWQGCAALLVLALHATPTVVYGTLRYPWAWKHLGVVEFISRNGHVDTGVADLSIYHGWPGFFSLNAMLVDAVGDLDLSAVAAWWPPLINLAILGALQIIAGAFTSDRRVVAVTCWIFVLVSWVGQDYFSPQATTYFLYLVVIGVVVRTLRVRPATEAGTLSGESPGGQGAALRMASIDRPSWLPIGVDGTRLGIPRRSDIRPGTPVVVWLLALAIASSHQLMPVMLVLTCTAFVALRYAGGVWLPVGLAVLTAGWVLVFAWPLLVENSDDIAVGAVTANFGGTVSDLGVVSPGHAFVSLVARVLTGMVAAAGIAGWLHVRHERASTGALVLMAAPLLLVTLTAYGGEILFRVYTFALPGAVFFIASLMVVRRTARRAAATVLAVSLVLVPTFLVAHLGDERMYSFTPEEVELVTALYEAAPAGSLLVEGSRNYPAQSRRYESFRYVPLDREPPATRARIVADPVAELERWLDDSDYTAAYVLLTRSMEIQTETLGTMPEDGLQHIEASLRASPRFTVLASNADGVVFTLAARRGDGPPIVLPSEERR